MIFLTEIELGQGLTPHVKPTHKATSQSAGSDARCPQLVAKTSRLILAALIGGALGNGILGCNPTRVASPCFGLSPSIYSGSLSHIVS